MRLATTTLVVMSLCCFIFGCGYSENHTVGRAAGWDLAADISGWAARRAFHTGDNLIFSYAPIHDVREVTQTNFELCRGSNPIRYFSGGLTVVPLVSPGTRYFICGTLGHCVLGLSLRVHVLPNGTAAAPTPAPTDDDGDGDGDSDNDARPALPSASPSPSPVDDEDHNSGAMHEPRPPRPSNHKTAPPPHRHSPPSPGSPCAKGQFCPPVVFSPPASTAPSAHASSGTTMAHLNLLPMACSIWLWLLVTGLSEYWESF